jgi:hypothetical protein
MTPYRCWRTLSMVMLKTAMQVWELMETSRKGFHSPWSSRNFTACVVDERKPPQVVIVGDTPAANREKGRHEDMNMSLEKKEEEWTRAWVSWYPTKRTTPWPWSAEQRRRGQHQLYDGAPCPGGRKGLEESTGKRNRPKDYRTRHTYPLNSPKGWTKTSMV